MTERVVHLFLAFGASAGKYWAPGIASTYLLEVQVYGGTLPAGFQEVVVVIELGVVWGL